MKINALKVFLLLLLSIILLESCKPIGITQYRQYFPIATSWSFLGERLGAQIEDSLIGLEQFIPRRMICQFPIRWMEIESTQGTYIWPQQLDQNVVICNNHIKIIGTRTSPTWARLWPEHIGSPPKSEYYSNYASFVVATCQRYNLDAMEIWNEPDCRPSEADMYWFGAWVGNNEKHYQGGQRYGQFLKTIYPLIKAGCPNTKIIGGALIGNTTSLEFINGVMSIYGTKFDAVSFHQYVYVGSDLNLPFAFANELSQITDLPLVLSETSVRGSEDTEQLRQFQADYLANLIQVQPMSNIHLIEWYSLEHDWQNTALVRNGQATPAWEVFSEALQ